MEKKNLEKDGKNESSEIRNIKCNIQCIAIEF